MTLLSPSSYLALAGYRAAPEWLCLQPLRGLCGGRSQTEQIRALRRYTEEAVQERDIPSPWDELVGGVVLGSQSFAQELLKKGQANRREQPQAARLERRLGWAEIVQAVERAKGEPWKAFCRRHGDWGRDAALWLGRRAGRMRLEELARAVGCDYTTAGKAVSRFGQRLKGDPELASTMSTLRM